MTLMQASQAPRRVCGRDTSASRGLFLAIWILEEMTGRHWKLKRTRMRRTYSRATTRIPVPPHPISVPSTSTFRHSSPSCDSCPTLYTLPPFHLDLRSPYRERQPADSYTTSCPPLTYIRIRLGSERERYARRRCRGGARWVSFPSYVLRMIGARMAERRGRVRGRALRLSLSTIISIDCDKQIHQHKRGRELKKKAIDTHLPGMLRSTHNQHALLLPPFLPLRVVFVPVFGMGVICHSHRNDFPSLCTVPYHFPADRIWEGGGERGEEGVDLGEGVVSCVECVEIERGRR